MKRLLAQIGIAYFSVLAIAFYLPEKAIWALLAASALLSVTLLIVRRTRRTVCIPALALTAFLGFGVNLGFTYLHVIPVQEQYCGEERRIEAVLTDESYLSYSMYYYRLDVDRVDGQEADCKLLLKTARPLDIEPFDAISFTADVYATDNRYYLSKGYYLTVNSYDDSFLIRERPDKPLYYQVIRLRRSFRSSLEKYLPSDVADLCKAIFIGDKYALDPQTKLDFRYAGASYFIVVSGMHFSIICLLFYRLLKRLPIHRFASAGITLAMILLYMSVTGFQPSVVRSAVMMIVYIGGCALRRINDSLTSLGLAGIVTSIAFSPYGAGDIGLILSFAATFAILSWSEPIYQRTCVKTPAKWHHRCRNAILRVMAPCLAANLLIFPISVFVFSAFSAATLVSALFLYLPVELILILSLAVCVFVPLGPLKVLALLLSWPLYALGRFVLWVVGALASVPFLYIRVGHSFFYIWLTVTILIISAAILLRKRLRLMPYAVILSAILLIGGTTVGAVIQMHTAELTAFACGDGLTVGLDYHGSLYMLSFDAGSYDAYRILNTLSQDYRNAELAVCSRKHDLVNYSRLYDKEFAVDRCLLAETDVRYDGTAELIAFDDADTYLLDDGVTLTPVEYSGRLASYLTIGETSVLIVPPRFSCGAIPDELCSADIIILSQKAKDYGVLFCDTLIVSDTDEISDAIAGEMKNNCRTVLCTAGEDITIPMEGSYAQ